MKQYLKKKRIKLSKGAFRGLAKKVFKRDRHTCQHCYIVLPWNMLAPHHIKSVGAGGDDSEKNLTTLCKTCHFKIHNGNIKL